MLILQSTIRLIVFIIFCFPLASQAVNHTRFNHKHTLSLDMLKGQTYLQAMIRLHGIKSHFDRDYIEQYPFIHAIEMEKGLNQFDKHIVNKAKSLFEKEAMSFSEFIQSLQGLHFSPKTLPIILHKMMQQKDIYALSNLLAMVNGAGTLINIDKDNYFINIAYRDGTQTKDFMSGRSYSFTPFHKGKDISDVYYLSGLEHFLKEKNEADIFYQHILTLLLETDIHPFNKRHLSKSGQSVLTDFLTIYTAEIDRHIMGHLNPKRHYWENDLAEVTFVAPFCIKTGKILKEGKLVQGHLKEWWAKSPRDNGRSGIGITRQDRRKLETFITSYVRQHYPLLILNLETLMGQRIKRNAYSAYVTFLNKYNTQARINIYMPMLESAFLDFLKAVSSDATEIESDIMAKTQCNNSQSLLRN